MEGQKLYRLRMWLDIGDWDYQDFGYNKSSLFHGALMQLISKDYAELMHQEGLRPYSQHVGWSNGRPIWEICTLTNQAYEEIIKPLLDEGFESIELEHNLRRIGIKDKVLEELSVSDMLDNVYGDNSENIFIISFDTPTAFKREGKYINFPDLYLLYRNIMARQEENCGEYGMFDEDMLFELTDNTRLLSYSLNSATFFLEGVRIPAFKGQIRVQVKSTQTVINYANMLFEYANYAGIGIKTALGMGYVNISQQRRRDNVRTDDNTNCS